MSIAELDTKEKLWILITDMAAQDPNCLSAINEALKTTIYLSPLLEKRQIWTDNKWNPAKAEVVFVDVQM